MNTLFIDATGKTSWLIPAQPGTHAPAYPTKFALAEAACFATADKTIGFCICKPGDSSSFENNYVIGLSTSTATARLK